MEYTCLEESVEKRARQSAYSEYESGVRSTNRMMYSVQPDPDESDNAIVCPLEEEAYLARHFNLIKNLKRLLQMRGVHVGM